jgi:hypothetical protein
METNLLKNTNAQYGENGVNGRIDAELSLNNEQKCMGGEGAPDLYFDRVGFATVESFNFHIHFYPFEKQFYIPAGFIEQSDDKSRQIEVISKKNEELIGFWIAINDTAQWSGIRLLGLGPRKPDNLVGDDANAFRLAGMTTVKLEGRSLTPSAQAERRNEDKWDHAMANQQMYVVSTLTYGKSFFLG